MNGLVDVSAQRIDEDLDAGVLQSVLFILEVSEGLARILLEPLLQGLLSDFLRLGTLLLGLPIDVLVVLLKAHVFSVATHDLFSFLSHSIFAHVPDASSSLHLDAA